MSLYSQVREHRRRELHSSIYKTHETPRTRDTRTQKMKSEDR